MSKYHGYEINVTCKGYEIFNDSGSTGTVCDSRELARRVIDDRIRSGRWPDGLVNDHIGNANKMAYGEELPGQMSVDDLIGGMA